ncbi:putative membrane protein [Microbacteriaceae bacterium SG_E_30_P1]|uniref:Membrane protein n=1 Tax=Antiquaquibacter oligotrophicus TaxID=2880260 RepID=A0ABT6KMT9_9MICO|nr:hypothetical protein [Antiquaquibacter oligotrophicus]MDH6181091.1 putative membrane protein [Antiquaquibacter oligotrophicus]UDF13211.1 DUF1345 domain-containing protein [Antiquaquibacter oligotrophicus]
MDAPAKVRAEHRWPVAIVVLAAFTIYAVLPDQVQILPRWVLPSLGVAALVPLLVKNPRRFSTESTWSRWLSLGFGFGLVLVNQVYVVLMIAALLDASIDGPNVLLTVLAVWATNVVAYGVLFWEFDGGGPVARRFEGVGDESPQDFLFPQQQRANDAWKPVFFDYLYFSLSNMMAFSPTDVMPLTTRAKALMGLQALTGFVILALVISRAVNILA